MNKNLHEQHFLVTKKEREQKNNHKAFTLWLTGLSGSGKSTLAKELDKWFFENNYKAYVLDGDNTRIGLNKDLNFTNEGRKENIRRVAEVAKLFNNAGIICICSFIAPFEEDRQVAKKIIDPSNYHEFFVNSSIEMCIKRDVKGLYKKALAGEIKNFTGIDSPYETPKKSDLILDTETLTTNECLLKVATYLKQKKLLNL